jgi:hypothetical protein
MANTKFSSSIAQCSIFSVVMAALCFACGCSVDVPQTPPDGAAEARIKSNMDAQKKFMANKKEIKNPVGEGKAAKGDK